MYDVVVVMTDLKVLVPLIVMKLIGLEQNH